MRPVDWVDKNQKYFWTEQWQEKMRRSQDALDHAEYDKFQSMEDCIKNLEDQVNANSTENKTL